VLILEWWCRWGICNSFGVADAAWCWQHCIPHWAHDKQDPTGGYEIDGLSSKEFFGRFWTGSSSFSSLSASWLLSVTSVPYFCILYKVDIPLLSRTPSFSHLLLFDKPQEWSLPLTLSVSKLWHNTDPFATELLMSVVSECSDLLLAGLPEENVDSLLAWHAFKIFSTTDCFPDSHGCSKHWWQVRRLLNNKREIIVNTRWQTYSYRKQNWNGLEWMSMG